MNELKKIAFISWLLLVVSFIIYKGIYTGWQAERSDFSNYYSSAKLVVEGEGFADFYNNDWFNKKAIEVGVKEGAKFSPFPPITAFLFIPLTPFSWLAAKKIWLIVNCLFLVLIVFQSNRLLTRSYLQTLLILSLFAVPIASNIRLGQTYLLFTFMILWAYNFIDKSKFNKTGVLIGFATAFKYFPILFLVRAKENWRKILPAFAITLLVTFLLPILFFGITPFQAFFSELLAHLNGNISGQGQFSYTFQSIDALLANLFIYDEKWNPNAPFRIPQLKFIIKVVFVMSVFLITWFAYRKNGNQTTNLFSVLVIVGGLLIIPASATYHLLFLIPAILIMYKELETDKTKFILLAITFLTCSVLPHHIPSVDNKTLNTLLHFPRLYGLVTVFIYTLTLQKRHSKTNG